MIEAVLNRGRGTGAIKHFGTLKVFNKEIEITFNGNHLYGLYLALVTGLVAMSAWLGLAVLVAYLVGEAKGWGEWVGALVRWEDKDEQWLEEQYRDDEGKKAPWVHQTANLICKEKVEGNLDERVAGYMRYAKLALAVRAMWWWMPVYVVMAMAGVVGWIEAVLAVTVLSIGMPVACWIGKQWKYEGKIGPVVMKRGWENQEIVYGAMQGLVFWTVVLL